MDDLTKKINMYLKKRAQETGDQALLDRVKMVENEDDTGKLPFDVNPIGSFKKMSKDKK